VKALPVPGMRYLEAMEINATLKKGEISAKEWQDVERGLEAMKAAVVISGLEGFIKSVSGEKVWRGGHEEQGKIECTVSYR